MPSYSLHFLEECFKLNHLIAPLFAYLNDAPAVTNFKNRCNGCTWSLTLLKFDTALSIFQILISSKIPISRGDENKPIFQTSCLSLCAFFFMLTQSQARKQQQNWIYLNFTNNSFIVTIFMRYTQTLDECKWIRIIWLREM